MSKNDALNQFDVTSILSNILEIQRDQAKSIEKQAEATAELSKNVAVIAERLQNTIKAVDTHEKNSFDAKKTGIFLVLSTVLAMIATALSNYFNFGK